MARIPISYGAYKRTGNPTLASVNCYVEEYPSASGPASQMRARAGLEAFKTLSSGPVRAIFQKDGTFDDAALILSNTTVSTLSSVAVLTALAGTIPGDDLVDIDSGLDADLNSIARVATGSALYKISGGFVALEDFPDVGGAGATSVAYHRGFWFAVEAGTDKVYVLIPGDVTWQALSFSSAEYGPDKLQAVRTRGDQIALMGSATFEVFTLSGNATDPIVPYGGLNFDHGLRNRTSAINCKGSLVYVDNECNVRRWDGGEPRIVSGPGLAEQIRGVSASDLRAWTYAEDGHRFYVLSLGSNATWVYDLNGTGEVWTTYQSLDYDYWRASLGCSIGDLTLAADRIEAKIWKLSPSLRYDGDVQFSTKFCAMIDGGDSVIPCSNVALLCDLGDAPREGQGSAPLIQLRISDNQGKTFGAARERPLGVTGDYMAVPRWNGLGDIPAFLGRIFEFTVADPVGRVFKSVSVNVP